METIEKTVAQRLLDIKAIQLNVEQPYTWASGWRAPIYCDTRKVLSYPDIRKLIYEGLQQLIERHFDDVEYIAGVATGAIAHGALVAEAMRKPFVYVRATPKEHGLSNSIEGMLPQGARVVVVEDLISTGGSSLQVVDTLRKAGAEVLGLTAIFSYNFISARRKFENADCILYTLTNYITLIEEALKRGYIKPAEMDTLEQWRETPDKWQADSKQQAGNKQ
ncbi:MAG: orotate phosphoribosyltransferase [Prevotellaceae bacterium]|jgi:orotate phosphoribosyltransferase|nr:orotate phosphoribosyltransferase [Prevotellaceae bacterium]